LFCTGRGTHIFALGALNTTIPYTLYAVAAESGIDVRILEKFKSRKYFCYLIPCNAATRPYEALESQCHRG
jgi:hypothetical protein